MISVVRELLQRIINDIDSGNSNLDENDCIIIAKTLNRVVRRDKPISKYKACEYIGKSRATFDNLVASGEIPEGVKEAGFKEKFWYKRDLDKYLKKQIKK